MSSMVHAVSSLPSSCFAKCVLLGHRGGVDFLQLYRTAVPTLQMFAFVPTDRVDWSATKSVFVQFPNSLAVCAITPTTQCMNADNLTNIAP